MTWEIRIVGTFPVEGGAEKEQLVYEAAKEFAQELAGEFGIGPEGIMSSSFNGSHVTDIGLHNAAPSTTPKPTAGEEAANLDQPEENESG